MSLIRIQVLGHDTRIQLDAEDNRVYHLVGGDELTVDMARVGDRLVVTLVRPADSHIRNVHEQPAETLEDFDRRTKKRRVR